MTAPPQEDAPLLRVEGLSVGFATARGPVAAVRDVSFTIAAGEVLALVGESGSGKSVTARTLAGLAGRGAEVRAALMSLAAHDGRRLDLLRLPERAWRRVRGREIGFVLQDALVSLDPLRTVGREIAEPILTHGLSRHAAVAGRVAALLRRVGIPDPAFRAGQYPHELSGGLRQRALIASALAGQPRLLIADEPTTALDVTIQRQVLAVFRALADAGHAVLVITHDLAAAAQIADRMAVMRQGRIVEAGPCRDVLGAPGHDYTRRLLLAMPTAATRGHRLSDPDRPPPERAPARSEAVLLDVRNVSVSFARSRGERFAALKNVSLQVREGETLGLVGESGSGKTTLGKVALALRRPDSGQVFFDGKPWSEAGEAERRPSRGLFGTISQDPLGSFDPRLTVAASIEQPLRLRRALDRPARRDRVAELLHLVGLGPELLGRRPATLSGGQRQRVSIAQALAGEPRLLICDEPVSALDLTTQAQVLDLLVELQGRMGLSLLFISHDLGVVQHMCRRIAVMKDGAIVETGDTERLFDHPQHPYTRELIDAIIRLPGKGAEAMPAREGFGAGRSGLGLGLPRSHGR